MCELLDSIRDRTGRRLVHVCSPMVRYSKLPFRSLVRRFGVDLCFTPMILADSFAASPSARDSEFTTNDEDRPLVVQFAANKVEDFVSASQLVQEFCEGVDLNCGCPQRWAWQEGIGARLLDRPQFVHDLVRQTRNRCRPGLNVSVKIRLLEGPEDEEKKKKTVEFSRCLEAAGIDMLTVHGRTRRQRSEPVDLSAVAAVVAALNVPVLTNGDARSLAEVVAQADVTGAAGVMAARGLLKNPAMFDCAGVTTTSVECIKEWTRIALECGTPFTSFHHHLIYMCESLLPRAERRVFNSLASTAAVLDFLEEHFDIRCPAL